jgi:hypothetical protein
MLDQFRKTQLQRTDTANLRAAVAWGSINARGSDETEFATAHLSEREKLIARGTQRDAQALDAGYTRLVYIDGGCEGGEFLVRHDADLDGRFKAWGIDWQDWTWVNGCNVLIEDGAA